MNMIVAFIFLAISLVIINFLLDWVAHEYKEFEVKVEPEEKHEKKESRPVLYNLNTTSVRYLFYSKSTFLNAKIKTLYKDVIVNNLWIQEPFHSSFVRLLSVIEENKLWIQVPKSKELILNQRNKDGSFSKGISIKVVYLPIFLSYSIVMLIKSKTIHARNSSDIQLYIIAYIIKLIMIANTIQCVKISKAISIESIFSYLDDLYDDSYKISLQEKVSKQIDHALFMQNLELTIRNIRCEKYLVRLDGSMSNYNQEHLYLPHIQKKQLIQIDAY